MDTHKENNPDGAPWRAMFGRLVGASSLVFVFVVFGVVVFSKGRKVSRHETLYNAFAFSREKNARVVERAFAEPCARTEEDIIFFAFVAVDRSFVAVGTRARWCESRDVMSSCDAHNVACVNTDVADGEVLSAFAAYVGVALVVLTAFGCVRAHVPIYTGRCHLRSLKMSGCAPRERRALRERRRRGEGKVRRSVRMDRARARGER